MIANRPALLEHLIDAGFTPGVEPAATPIGSMHELGALLFGGTDVDAAAESRVDIAGAGPR